MAASAAEERNQPMLRRSTTVNLFADGYNRHYQELLASGSEE